MGRTVAFLELEMPHNEMAEETDVVTLFSGKDLVVIPSSFAPTCHRLMSWLRQPRRTARRPERRPQLEILEGRTLPASGPWTALTNLTPSSNGTGTMMLLSDGTVMVNGGGSATESSAWYKLTPDATGSYSNGTWTTLASMHTPRLYFASNIMVDGRVFLEGGEYTNQGQVFTNTGEIYDPVANTWTTITKFPNSQFGDDPSQVLQDGTVFTGYISGPQTYTYNATTNAWTFAANKLRNEQSDEEGFSKLPNGDILSYDVFSSVNTGNSTAQYYNPSTNTWNDAGPVPVLLSSSGDGFELGPQLLLPGSGNTLVIGANGNTALYNYTTNSWSTGPVVPNGHGADDAPGAVLPSGNVLFAADKPLFSAPTQIFLYNATTNTISGVGLPSALKTSLNSKASYVTRMVNLPNGQILFSDSTDQLYVFNGGFPQSAWRPTISSVVNNNNGTYTLTGTQLNGMSEGSAYGDDVEMATNFPVIYLKNASTGGVFYCRTTGWSNTWVQTGTTPETVNFTLPSGLPTGTYSLFSTASGMASRPFSFTVTGPSGSPLGAAFTTTGTVSHSGSQEVSGGSVALPMALNLGQLGAAFAWTGTTQDNTVNDSGSLITHHEAAVALQQAALDSLFATQQENTL
jgi:hypothetical protein